MSITCHSRARLYLRSLRDLGTEGGMIDPWLGSSASTMPADKAKPQHSLHPARIGYVRVVTAILPVFGLSDFAYYQYEAAQSDKVFLHLFLLSYC